LTGRATPPTAPPGDRRGGYHPRALDGWLPVPIAGQPTAVATRRSLYPTDAVLSGNVPGGPGDRSILAPRPARIGGNHGDRIEADPPQRLPILPVVNRGIGPQG
jgi:hypothetical protein